MSLPIMDDESSLSTDWSLPMADKRQHLRVPIRMAVACEVEGIIAFSAVATDISLGGSRLESSSTPSFGTHLTIVGRLPGASKPCRLPAIVRWGGPGFFGVQFGSLDARNTYRIADLMKDELRARRRT